MARVSYRGARRIAVFVVGSVLLAIGLALLVLPGPGTPVVLLALSILASEFAWARVCSRRLRVSARRAARRARARWSRSTKPQP